MRILKKFFKGMLPLGAVFLASFIITTGITDGFAPDKLLGNLAKLVPTVSNSISVLSSEDKATASARSKDLGSSDSRRDKDTASDSTEDNASDNDSTEEISSPSAWSRISRTLFLKEAVAKRINRSDYVSIQEIPESLQQAVVAVEDRKFYDHWGFDTEGILRASLVNLQYGEVKEGASTITQQLVKNLFLSQEQTMGRKVEELLLAMDMEMNYSKEEILELYLNTIYFGSGYYGIKEASLGYFGKEPAMLALPEAAMLAGIPNAPSLYSPYIDFMLAKKRQFIVLDAMVAAGYLRENVAEDAKIKPIYLDH